jgi:hypothetical protein
MRQLFQSLRRHAGLIKLSAEISTILGFCFQYVFPLVTGLVAMLVILLRHPGPGPNPRDLSGDSRAAQRIEVPDHAGDSCFGYPSSVGQPAESCLGTGPTASDPVGSGPEPLGGIQEIASDNCDDWRDVRQRATCKLHVPAEKLLANDCDDWRDIRQRATCKLHVPRVNKS